MRVEHIEFLVEELSMETALRGILPKILGDVSFEIYPHSGKREMLRRLPRRLQGYASFLPEEHRIVIVIDRDDDDCHRLKRGLESMAAQAGLRTRTMSRELHYSVVNRLVIEELEAWYFGDWDAVRAVYPRVPKTIPQQTKYRHPDAIAGGTWEAFERIMRNAGYFKGGLRKIEIAREISAQMNVARNTSQSFQILRHALLEMVQPRTGLTSSLESR